MVTLDAIGVALCAVWLFALPVTVKGKGEFHSRKPYQMAVGEPI
jgi:hypothetical protein